MLTVFYYLVVAKYIPASAFIFSYAVEGDLTFTTEEATWLDFANKACFVVGGGLAVLFAMVFDVHPMIFTEVFGSGAGACNTGHQSQNWAVGFILRLSAVWSTNLAQWIFLGRQIYHCLCCGVGHR